MFEKSYRDRSPSAPSRMMSRRLLLPLLGAISIVWMFVVVLNNIGLLSYSDLPQLKSINPAGNRTLGFGEIFMAILPQRSDHLDAASLLAHYSELDITIVDGVPKEDILEKSLPKGEYRPEGGGLGCWRAHMNMLRKVIDKGLETALILESDADWDVRIKDQMIAISEHLSDSSFQYPYGNNWSFFWIGQCWHEANPEQLGPVTVYTDDTINPWKDQTDWVQKDAETYGVETDFQRMIYQAYNPLCTGAYAVTLKGALRMLYEIGYDHLNKPVDKEYQKATREGKIPGMIVNPPVMAQWKTGTVRDSEVNPNVMDRPIEKLKNVGQDRGRSGPSIQMSARKQLRTWALQNVEPVE